MEVRLYADWKTSVLQAPEFQEVKQILESLDEETCDTCEGRGYYECDCCGHNRDCDDCDGKGDVRPETLAERLDETLYFQCLEYEKEQLRLFQEGEAVPAFTVTKSGARQVHSHHPLDSLLGFLRYTYIEKEKAETRIIRLNITPA